MRGRLQDFIAHQGRGIGGLIKALHKKRREVSFTPLQAGRGGSLVLKLLVSNGRRVDLRQPPLSSRVQSASGERLRHADRGGVWLLLLSAFAGPRSLGNRFAVFVGFLGLLLAVLVPVCREAIQFAVFEVGQGLYLFRKKIHPL